MRSLLSLSFPQATALVVLPVLIGACSTSSDHSDQTNASEINQQPPAVDEGVVVGPEGGGVRDSRGVFSVVVPQGALAQEARVIVQRDPNGQGAQGTPLYRVTIDPPDVALKYPVQMFLDLEKERAGFGDTLKDPVDLRLAMSVAGAETSEPTTPLTKIVRKDLKNGQFIGSSKDLGRSFGLIEAKKIDCDGTSCSNCCLVATSRLTCSPACSFDAGELTVDCLKDSDCGGGGLKCCTPGTVRGGGVLRVDDNRITCKADCGGENLHVCDMLDPNRCSDCAPAVMGCKRGFCGHTSKTPTQLICP